jgi:hypothetical protein
LAQDDSLYVRLSSLEPGVVVLQHMVIDQPANAVELSLGLYDPRTGQRLNATLPTGEVVETIQVPLK